MGDHIILPGHVSDEYESGNDVSGDVAQAMAFRHLLKTLDPYLDLIWVKEGAVNFPKAARWYIVRKHPGGNDELNTYWIVENPDGSYCVPDDRHIERLRQMDSHTRDVYEDIRQRRTNKKAAHRKQFDETRRAFRELLEERLASNERTSVTIPDKPAILGPDGKALQQVSA